MRANLRTSLPLVLLLMGGAAPVVLAQGIAGLAQQPLANATLDNLTFNAKNGGTITIRKVDATATNLSKDELAKLFNPETSKTDAVAIAAKMKAEKLSIPEIALTSKDARFTIQDVVVSGVAEGKVAGFRIAGMDGSGKTDEGVDISVKARPLEMKGLNISQILAGLKAGELTDGTMQLGSVNWQGFEASFPDKDTLASSPGGNLVKVSLASLIGENTYDGVVPTRGSAKAEHLVVEMPKGSKVTTELAKFGQERVDLGFTVAMTYDKTKKLMNLEDYTINGVNAGAIGLKGAFGGVDPVLFSAGAQKTKLASLMGADIGSLALSYSDSGLFAKSLAYVADMQGKTADALKTEWTQMTVQFLPLILGGDPSALKIVEAVTKFIADPKNLTISAKAKGASVKVTDLMSLANPQALLSKIELSAVANQ